MRILLLFLCLLGVAPGVRPAHSQEPPAAAQQGALRVYLDCSGFSCDVDYLREEVGFVSHVRDRADADVHVLATRQETGGGGLEHTLAFIGLGRFAGVQQTLRYVSEPGEPAARTREGLAQVLKLGLVRYAAELPQGRRLRVSYEAPGDDAAAEAPERDPWNHWTFRVAGSGSLSGEQSYANSNVYGSLSAGRITERWKLRMQLSGTGEHSEYETDEETIVNDVTGWEAQGGVVRSLGRRLSAGVMASALRSSYLNQDLALRVAPAVELNVFPYAESTRRQLTVLYSVGPQHLDYQDTTIFARVRETMVRQNLLATLVLKQPWGSTNVSLEGASYLQDVKKNRLSLGGGVEVSLLRGLSLDAGGSYQRIRDQVYLSAAGATDEDILLQRKQLATGFQYFGYVGVSYTFGSRFTTIVNPRFGSSGGQIVVIN